MMKKIITISLSLLIAVVVFAGNPLENMMNMLEQLKTGYIDINGNFVYEVEFDWGSDFRDGYAEARIGDSVNAKWKKVFLLQKNGERTEAPKPKKKKYKISSYYGNGIWSFSIKKKKQRMYGLMNIDSEIIVEPQYSSMRDISEGLIAVKKDNKWGYIYPDGKVAIEPKYESSFLGEDFKEGFAPVKIDGKWGYINKSGEVAVKPQYNSAKNFSEGMAEVEIGNKSGYVNTEGKLVIDTKYEMANPFSEGVAHVTTLENDIRKHFYIDKTGKVVLELDYESCGDLREGLICFSKDNRNASNRKWGFVDLTGNVVIEPVFVANDFSGTNFSEGFAVAGVKVYQYGYIDKTGKYFMPPIFHTAKPFKDGIAKVTTFPKEVREEFFKEWLKK